MVRLQVRRLSSKILWTQFEHLKCTTNLLTGLIVRSWGCSSPVSLKERSRTTICKHQRLSQERCSNLKKDVRALARRKSLIWRTKRLTWRSCAQRTTGTVLRPLFRRDSVSLFKGQLCDWSCTWAVILAAGRVESRINLERIIWKRLARFIASAAVRREKLEIKDPISIGHFGRVSHRLEGELSLKKVKNTPSNGDKGKCDRTFDCMLGKMI